MKKVLAAAATIVAVSLTLAACGSSSTSGGTGGSTGKNSSSGGLIGFSYGNETSGIYPLIANPAKAEAAKKGYQLIEGDANGSCTKQVQNLQDFIARKVKAIVVLPLCGTAAVKNVLRQAEAAKIVVVGYSQPVAGSSAVHAADRPGTQAC